VVIEEVREDQTSDWLNVVIGNNLIAVYEALYFTETLSYGSEKSLAPLVRVALVRVALVRVATPTLSLQIELLYARHGIDDRSPKSVYRRRCYATTNRLLVGFTDALARHA
jgi:hypothetical protein